MIKAINFVLLKIDHWIATCVVWYHNKYRKDTIVKCVDPKFHYPESDNPQVDIPVCPFQKDIYCVWFRIYSMVYNDLKLTVQNRTLIKQIMKSNKEAILNCKHNDNCIRSAALYKLKNECPNYIN